ncbi:TolC family protein [Pseudaestuariivita rosea]|uniref:TolC family protein n=1 Tax=Pseudaestuariivita rosea TaxID=2763263 RepID=UPI001ABA93B9|nr:TolC family protein [Pseudaestuariivita rosea]
MRSVIVIAFVLGLAGCALPELDGRPVKAVRASDLAVSEPTVWALDFGDRDLRRMLDEADIAGLDVVAARARTRAADLTLAQIQRNRAPRIDGTAVAQRQETETETTQSVSYTIEGSFEPDLTGRLNAALQAAKLERKAQDIDLLIARRELARAVVEGWIALAEATTTAARANEKVRLAEAVLPAARARAAAGESTSLDVARQVRELTNARVEAAQTSGQIALAKARLRALGVRTIPNTISLRDLRRPSVPAHTDLDAVTNRPSVCAAWLRFHAADASRAETLRSTRPRLVVTGSLAATARTLAGVLSGNAAALSNSVRLEGTFFDDGSARRGVDRARLSVAEAEIAWLQTRARAEIAALEAIVDLQGAEAQLDSSFAGYRLLATDLEQARARRQAGVDAGVTLIEAQSALASAQTEIDTARAAAFRAALRWHDQTGTTINCTIEHLDRI